MTPDHANHHRKPRTRALREAFILTAMVLVTLAVAAGLIVQFGWPMWTAGLAALGMYVALVSAHALARRTEAIRELSSEIERLEDEVSWIRQRTPGAPLQAAPQVKAPEGPRESKAPASEPVPRSPAPRPASTQSEPSQAVGPSPAGAKMPSPASPVLRNAQPAPPAADAARRPEPSTAPAKKDTVARDVTATASGETMGHFWAFRPNDPHTPSSEPIPQPEFKRPPEAPRSSFGKKVAQPENVSEPTAAEQSVGTPAVAGDVGVIGGMIRKFAQEIVPGSASETSVETPKPSTGAAQSEINASVDALRAAANEMRRSPAADTQSPIERGVLPPLKPEKAKGPLPPPVDQTHARLSAIADGIATDKFDVYLEPIVALGDRKVRHYEIALRLRTEPPGSMGAEDYVPAARGTGMLPFIDTIRITRAAAMAHHMDQRGSGGSLFASLTAESLTNQGFQWEFAEACRHTPKLADRLVLTFEQSDIRSFAAPHWDAIRQLTGAGFRLAIDDAVSLDPDLPDLKAAGFAFLRCNARTLVDGMASLEGPMTGARLRERLSGAGLMPIVKAIETDAQFARIMEAGISLGQGPLFGPRLPIKAQVLQPSRGVVAA